MNWEQVAEANEVDEFSTLERDKLASSQMTSRNYSSQQYDKLQSKVTKRNMALRKSAVIESNGNTTTKGHSR